MIKIYILVKKQSDKTERDNVEVTITKTET